MPIRKLFLVCFVLFNLLTYTVCLGAVSNTAKDNEMDDETAFNNEKLLAGIFQKLYNLEKNKRGKVNIVHIGDSHIQADFFTNAIRESLQSQFGDGGYGFTFPYSLLRSNGTRNIRYTSNVTWQSLLNVYPVADVGVGLSGIALYTSSDNFIVQLAAEEKYKFSSIKIIYPSEEPHFKISVDASALQVSAKPTGKKHATMSATVKYHVVKKGESLSSIANKYGTTSSQIKSLNGMRKNNINPGKRLKIPVKTKSIPSSAPVENNDTEYISDFRDSLRFVNTISKPYYSSYTSPSELDRITIVPDGKSSMYNINGFVIQNNDPGVVYHTIGVNGAKLSDYNKYPLFFKQLPILEPDLIILSFGTNESFGKLSVADYIYQLNEFVANIRKLNKQAVILVMTPPPSMFKRVKPNQFVNDYSMALMGLNNLPVWDLYARMGGAEGISREGDFSSMIARDKVHYTQRGYEVQGTLFATDFINAYNNFKKNKQH